MESAPSPKVTEADNTLNPSVFQQPKRPNSAVINSLFSIAACSSKINEVKMCQKELENHKQIIQENFMFQRKCQQMAYDLEAERKTHAEELRLINQDINHLEDMMKGIKAAHEQQRSILRQKYAAFRSQILLTNQLCRDCGLADENLIPFNSIRLPDWLIDKPLPKLIMPSPATAAAMAAAANSTNPFFPSQISSSSTSTTFRTPFSNYFYPSQLQPSSASSSSSIGHLHPRPFGTFLEDISKLKDCQSCKQKIHRNAPICPLCKSKNSSKAKKPRKNL